MLSSDIWEMGEHAFYEKVKDHFNLLTVFHVQTRVTKFQFIRQKLNISYAMLTTRAIKRITFHAEN